MKPIYLGFLALVSTVALAQSTTAPFFVKNEVGQIGVELSLRTDPPSSSLARRYSVSSRGRSITNGPTFYSRILVDKVNHTYFGYELLIEQQQPGIYLATFGTLGVTPLDLMAGSTPRLASDSNNSTRMEWVMTPLPAIPEAHLMHDTDVVTIVLFADAATGAKLVDDVRINPPRISTVPQVPTVSGPVRDFSVADAELQFVQPRLTLNRSPQAGPHGSNSHGALVWLYFPDHGRYIMSLMPRANLGFKKAGEVRGGALTFSLDEDTVKLECMTPIASGDAAYNLYVLHDEDWEPTAESQKDWPAMGTISVSELAALDRK